ncbi:MAG: hypothetical protein IH621_08360 [Krumholzibacteria bacterium]|nr:hypothetical protein [Candidatus Krumholzibacteria bacterium]
MRPKRVLLGLLAAGIVGWAVFGAWLWRVSDVRRALPAEARAAAAAVRDLYPDHVPWLLRDADGRFIRTDPPGTASGAPARRPRHLHVLAWQADERRLVRTDIPFWYLKLKEISLKYLLRRAGVDLDSLGLRPRDLETLGPGLVLDQEFATGDLLLIWTE